MIQEWKVFPLPRDFVVSGKTPSVHSMVINECLWREKGHWCIVCAKLGRPHWMRLCGDMAPCWRATRKYTTIISGYTSGSHKLLADTAIHLALRRVHGENLHDDCVWESSQGGGGSVIVLGCIHYAGKTELHVTEKSINTAAYQSRLQEHYFQFV